jgi:hypothetical protein
MQDGGSRVLDVDVSVDVSVDGDGDGDRAGLAVLDA